jgi:NAD(P)-dependent dehydrogenase (short-subunit alcohol dehydrogenase family)
VEAWRKVIEVNLNGTFYMSRAFGRALAESGHGGLELFVGLEAADEGSVGFHSGDRVIEGEDVFGAGGDFLRCHVPDCLDAGEGWCGGDAAGGV